MRNHILLVEDDLDLGLVLKQYLQFSGFEITWFSNPLEAVENLATLENIQLAIIDVMMPEINGFDLSKIISERSKIPFLFLTAKAQSIDRILGLKLGADDYIAKPCEPEELLLRVKTSSNANKKVNCRNLLLLASIAFYRLNIKLYLTIKHTPLPKRKRNC